MWWKKYGCTGAHPCRVSLCPVCGHATLLPWRLLPGRVAMDMDYPRPAPTTIHYLSRCAPLFLYIYSWALPPVWSGRYLVHIIRGRSAAQFAAAPCNSFLVHVQSLNIRSLFSIIVWPREIQRWWYRLIHFVLTFVCMSNVHRFCCM